MIDTLVVIGTDGLIYAAWLFLIALGLSLIYGVLRVLNIAHGSFYALGAYTAASLIGLYGRRDLWPYGVYLMIPLAALAVGVVVGPLVERGILRWMYSREPVYQLLATYALFLIFEDLTKLVWGVDPIYAYAPYTLLGEVSIGDITYPGYSLLLVGTAVVVGILVSVFIRRTRTGRIIVAMIEDPEMSMALGINVPRMSVLAFSMGTVLAGLGGAMTAPMIAVMPGMGAEVIVLAFAVVVLGGLGSLEGAAVGALLIGLLRAAAVHLFPVLELFVIYLVMALVLILRPRGLWGRMEVRRL
ncbi:High-affinity branched-chain amino acid transport system permease protein LivH [bacterium HR11]|nr:High-affinity branched-chain amino acid transport system permease protein LivH [bacterium HR11]